MAGKNARKNARSELREQLDMAGRLLSTATIMFHTAVSDLQGLSTSEEKALELLQRLGPMTAGELAAKSGLAPASVTGLVDRLEHKGFARRAVDERDRRRVRVELVPGALQRFAPSFQDFMTKLHAVYEDYTTDELKVVLRFLGDVARVQEAAAAKLRASARRPERS